MQVSWFTLLLASTDHTIASIEYQIVISDLTFLELETQFSQDKIWQNKEKQLLP